MSTFEILKFKMSSSEGRERQQKFKVKVLKFQVFKVSNLRWKSNMGNVSIQNFNIWNVKFRRDKDKQQKIEVKVSDSQVWGGKVTWEIWTFEILKFEISSVRGQVQLAKIRG